MTNKKPVGGNGFKKGKSGNPAGRKPIYADYNTRALYILDKYTVGEIMGMVEAMQKSKDDCKTVEDKNMRKAARALPGRDLSIMMSIATSFTTEGALPFSNLLDRAVGKPVQHLKVEQNMTLTDHRAVAEAKAEDMLMRLAKRREDAKVIH